MINILIAFDIDGTLRCNCTETCRDTNEDVVQLARILHKMKNVKLVAWSAGGAEYAQAFIDSDTRLQSLFSRRCYSKLSPLKPDIAIDDIQDFTLGTLNLIVREK